MGGEFFGVVREWWGAKLLWGWGERNLLGL